MYGWYMQDSELLELLTKVKGGEDSAFELLVKQYEPLITSVCSRYKQSIFSDDDVSAAADLTQELTYTLYRAAVSYNTMQDDVTFGRYAKRCLENRAISFLRKVNAGRRREQKVEERLRRENIREHTFEVFFPGIGDSERNAVLETISDLLSTYEYKVFTMYIEGLSSGEIGAELGRDEKSVNNAVFRSKSKIRRFYKANKS